MEVFEIRHCPCDQSTHCSKLMTLKPDEFVWQEVSAVGRSSPGGAAAVARGLRDEKNWQWFCENFMECVIPSAEWKLLARKRVLLECVSASLEAFAVLVCKNGHAKWNEAFQLNGSDGETATSSLTNGSNGKCHFLFAGDSKGSRKHEGWNADGMQME
jgi:hypothetical protein